MNQFSVNLTSRDLATIEAMRSDIQEALGIKLSRNAIIRRLISMALNTPEINARWLLGGEQVSKNVQTSMA